MEKQKEKYLPKIQFLKLEKDIDCQNGIGTEVSIIQKWQLLLKIETDNSVILNYSGIQTTCHEKYTTRELYVPFIEHLTKVWQNINYSNS